MLDEIKNEMIHNLCNLINIPSVYEESNDIRTS